LPSSSSWKNTKHRLPIIQGKRLSAANTAKRLEFCEELIESHYNTWAFTESKDVYLYEDKHGPLKRAWQKLDKGMKGLGTTPWVFQFYGVVSYEKRWKLCFIPPSSKLGKRAHRSKEAYTAERYIDMPKKSRKEVELWFPPPQHDQVVQDNASHHTVGVTKDNISSNGLKVVKGGPPQAWDLDIIENVWGAVNNNLCGVKATSSDGCRKAIEVA
jgi:hypothetical protein